MKTWLGGKIFSSKEEIIAATNEYFEGFDKNYITLGWSLPRGSFLRLKFPKVNFANQNDTMLWLVETSPNTPLILQADALVPQQISYSKIVGFFDLSMVRQNAIKNNCKFQSAVERIIV